MAVRPTRFGGNNFIDSVAKFDAYGDGQPASLIAVQNLNPVGIAIFAKLDIVEKDENIRLRDLSEVSEPRQIVRLMNCDDQSVLVMTVCSDSTSVTSKPYRL